MMDAQTGRRLVGLAHLRQSITDVLTTPIGSRAMRRRYGSAIFPLIDQPDTPANRLRLIAATADALARWEPRIALQRVGIQVSEDGRPEVDIEGDYQPDGRRLGVVLIEGVTL